MSGRKKIAMKDRFFEKVAKGDGDDCWMWLATKTVGGYGQMRIGKVFQLAHRISYEVHIGEIPRGLYVLHHCDVRGCVNPSHLFVGTQSDNIKDAMRKGRIARGERSGTSKLTEQQVEQIRAHTGTQREIAKLMGVWQGCISSIKSGRRWAHSAKQNKDE